MKKILVTGSNGLLGSAFKRIAPFLEHNFIFVTRKDCDLTSESQVDDMLAKYKPDWIIHAAGKVGGVKYNTEFPDELFYENTMMNTLLIHYAKKYQVEKLVAFVSTCSFPADTPYIEENILHLGPPHHTNMAYACSKRALDIQIQAYRKRWNLDYYTIIPSNLFGMQDTFDTEAGHVVAALINKCYHAAKNKEKVIVWGDGSQVREFIFADDLAKATIEIMHLNHTYDKIIISNQKPISIKKLALLVAQACALPPENLIFDTSKPAGLHKRSCNTERFRSLTNFTFTDHKTAINKTVQWFKENYPKIRGLTPC